MSALKITLLLALTLSLSSCFMDREKSEPTKTPTTDTVVSTNPVNCTEVDPLDATGLAVWEAGSLPDGTDDMAGSGDIVYVNYTLRSCTADGEMIDTSREADAMAGGIYMTGRTYEPFSTIIGSHQTVRGFEHGLIGMKKGERKTIVVAPVDGYGGAQETVVQKAQVAPEYTTKLDITFFQDVVTETVNRELLGEVGKTIKVGQTLTGGQNGDIPAKVTKVTDTEVTVEIDNSSNPFHGKELKAGTTAEVQSGTTLTIKSIEGTGITLDVVDNNSPFYGNYSVGASTVLPIGKVTIKSIDEETVTLSIEEMASNTTDPKKKTLFFDVEIVDIK